MTNPFSRRHLTGVLLTAMISVVFASMPTVLAQETSYTASFDNMAKEPIAVNVLVGQSRVINFDRQIGRFSISNPEVAEAVMVTPSQVLVNGKSFGQVNFIAWDKNDDHKYLVFDVFVRANLSLIDSQIRALFPKDDIRLSQANGSVVLSGTVSDPQAAQQADNVVQSAGFKTVNMLQSPIGNLSQVQLQVRVAEVSRQKMRDLGATYAYQSGPGVGGIIGSGGGPWSATSVDQGNIFGALAGSALNLFVMGGNTYNFIRALQQSGALRSLAEPNLIAMNGQTASFLAGGEFPVPVVQSGGGGGGASGNAVTVQFKEYGVRLNFKPTIIDEDHIRLEMEPEVSTIDFGNGVKLNGFQIPALKTRRAHTGVELRDGQSFALAGLLDNSETRSLSKIPLIGDIPILGALFNSKSYQKNETELMFIVTAQLVKPVNRDDLPAMKGVDGLKGSSPLGIEKKENPVTGQSGFSTGSADSPQEPPVRLVPAVPPKTDTAPATKEAPATKDAPAATTGTTTTVGSVDDTKTATGVGSEKKADPAVAQATTAAKGAP
jgi:pilus assembly protein CpaC